MLTLPRRHEGGREADHAGAINAEGRQHPRQGRRPTARHRRPLAHQRRFSGQVPQPNSLRDPDRPPDRTRENCPQPRRPEDDRPQLGEVLTSIVKSERLSLRRTVSLTRYRPPDKTRRRLSEGVSAVLGRTAIHHAAWDACVRTTVTRWWRSAERTIASNTATPCRMSSGGIGYERTEPAPCGGSASRQRLFRCNLSAARRRDGTMARAAACPHSTRGRPRVRTQILKSWTSGFRGLLRPARGRGSTFWCGSCARLNTAAAATRAVPPGWRIGVLGSDPAVFPPPPGPMPMGK